MKCFRSPVPHVALLNSAFIFCLAFAFPVAGANLKVVLEQPDTNIVAGQQASLSLDVLNPGSTEQRWTFPATVRCRLTASNSVGEAAALQLSPTPNRDVTIAPGRFERREYLLLVPVSIVGHVLLECDELKINAVVLNVAPRIEGIAAPAKRRSWFQMIIEEAEPLPPGEKFDAARFFKQHVSAYEPLYFIAGTESPNAKFQISFKYRVLNLDGPLARAVPPLTGFHVAYSQTSLWDWEAASAPFFDSSYRPEALYLVENITCAESNDWFRLDAQVGVQHESNGKSGTDSRSLNIVYFRPRAVFGKHDGFQLVVQPRVWAYVGDLSDNPDIDEFRGYADLRTIIGWERGPQLSAIGRLGKDGDHESIQLDFTYPLMGFFPKSFSLYLHVQYFTGFGESLLRYNQRDSALRGGFSLTR
jgi:phospholipase A1/A2